MDRYTERTMQCNNRSHQDLPFFRFLGPKMTEFGAAFLKNCFDICSKTPPVIISHLCSDALEFRRLKLFGSKL